MRIKGFIVIGLMLCASVALATNVRDNMTFDGEVKMTGEVTLDGNAYISELNYSTSSASTDAYVATLTPAPTAYDEGMYVAFKTYTANTGASTLNVNSLGAKSIKILNDQDPGNRCFEADQVSIAIYDGTNFQLQAPCAN